jgi:hypothetical protein
MAGYSPSPLIKKLGIKDSYRVCFVGAPEAVLKRIKIPKKIEQVKKLSGACDYIHIFCTDAVKLEKLFRDARAYVKMNGMIWISWPKKASGTKTNLSEDLIRAYGLNFGLVDVKVAAIDDTWSGLKFVYRLKDR